MRLLILMKGIFAKFCWVVKSNLPVVTVSTGSVAYENIGLIIRHDAQINFLVQRNFVFNNFIIFSDSGDSNFMV